MERTMANGGIAFRDRGLGADKNRGRGSGGQYYASGRPTYANRLQSLLEPEVAVAIAAVVVVVADVEEVAVVMLVERVTVIVGRA